MHKRLFLEKSGSEIVKGYSDFRAKFVSSGILEQAWLKLRHPVFYHHHRENLDMRTSTEKFMGEHELHLAKSLAGEYKRLMRRSELKAKELEKDAELSEKIIASKNMSLANLEAQLQELKTELEKGGKKQASERF